MVFLSRLASLPVLITTATSTAILMNTSTSWEVTSSHRLTPLSLEIRWALCTVHIFRNYISCIESEAELCMKYREPDGCSGRWRRRSNAPRSGISSWCWRREWSLQTSVRGKPIALSSEQTFIPWKGNQSVKKIHSVFGNILHTPCQLEVSIRNAGIKSRPNKTNNLILLLNILIFPLRLVSSWVI